MIGELLATMVTWMLMAFLWLPARLVRWIEGRDRDV